MSPNIREVSSTELKARREQILRRVGVSFEELAAKAASRSLAGYEWAAWEEVQEIDFLLGADE